MISTVKMIRNYQRSGGSGNVDLAPIYNSINALQIQVNNLYNRTETTTSSSTSSTVSSESSTITVNGSDILHNITAPGTYTSPISYDATFFTTGTTISGINSPSILIGEHSIKYSLTMRNMTADLMSYVGAGANFNGCVFKSVIAEDTAQYCRFSSCSISSFKVNGYRSFTSDGNVFGLFFNSITSCDIYYPNGYINLANNSIYDVGVTANVYEDYGGTIEHYRLQGNSICLYGDAHAFDINIVAKTAVVYGNSCNAINMSVFQSESTNNGWILSLSGCSAEYANIVGVMYAENVRDDDALVQKCTFNTFSLDHNKIQISSNSFKDIAVLNIDSGSLMFNTCTGLMEGYIDSFVGRDNILRVGRLYYRTSGGPGNTIESASHF